MFSTTLDVARIAADVADQDRALLGDGRADDALPDLQPEVLDDFFRIADGVGDAQIAAALVEQIDREDRERREPRDELRNLLQQLVEIEDGGDLASEVEQRGQQLRVRAAGRLSERTGRSSR